MQARIIAIGLGECLKGSAASGDRHQRRTEYFNDSPCRDGRLVPMEVWPDLTAAPPASLAGEQRFDIAETDVIRPLICADRGRMAARGNF
jgi:hypothetical protein